MIDPDEIRAVQKFQGRSSQIMTLLIMASRDGSKLECKEHIEYMAEGRVDEFNELLPEVRSLMGNR